MGTRAVILGGSLVKQQLKTINLKVINKDASFVFNYTKPFRVLL